MTEWAIGIGVALGLGCFAWLSGFDRDRVFYPMVAAVTATYYALFAVMGNAMEALAWESAAGSLFLALAVAGFRKNLWLAVVALAAHGAFDVVHSHLITNPGMPAWWPGFCMGFDVGAGGLLAVMLGRRREWPARIISV